MRASPTDNPLWRPLRRASAIMFLAAATAGCSLSFPIEGFTTDHTATGSIRRPAAFLSPELDEEDLRRARAALAVALDPQGNGDRVGWLNPQTGAHGSFAAVAPPFTAQDRVCRAFAAEVAPTPGSQRRVAGSACREGDGTWKLLDDAGPRA